MSDSIHFLYHNNFWDGPLSGVCRIGDHQYYFDCINDYHEALDLRIYSLHELTEEEWKTEDYWHQEFEKYVGTHTNYAAENHRSGEVKDSSTHHLFYDASAKRKEDQKYRLSLDSAVGYFDRHEMKFRSTIFRDYFIDGDRFSTFHERNCEHFDLIIWNNKSQFFDFHENEEGTRPGWSLQFKDGIESYPLGIIFCPWCSKKLPLDLKDFCQTFSSTKSPDPKSS